MYFLTFFDSGLRRSLGQITGQASLMGFEGIFAWNEADMGPDFLKQHGPFIRDNPRGYGYWIWKPHLIYSALKMIPQGSSLLYADGGCSLNPEGKRRLVIYEFLAGKGNGIFAFHIRGNHSQFAWTKMDAIERVGGDGAKAQCLAATAVFVNTTNESIEVEICVNKNLKKLMRIKSYDDKSYELCLTTLEKNETFLLEPWINYHLSMGVEHFFIYDNDSGDFNEIKNILTPYINAGIVTLIFWPFPKQMQESGISGQTTQQNHCFYTNHNTNWLGLSDVDEFLVPKKANNLGQFLEPYKKLRSSSAALSIQSAWFGCNNGIEFTQSDFLSKLDKRHSNFEPKHNRQKTIAIPRNVKVYSVHMVVYGHETIYLEPDLIALNHYYVFSNRQCDHALYDQIADHRIGQLISENRIYLVGNRAS
jgi:hypothetical protein